MSVDLDRARAAVRELLLAFHLDPDAPGILETPDRVARMYAEVLGGYNLDASCLERVFEVDHDPGIVLVNNINFTSWCEHHLMPFAGQASVAYLPQGRRVVGLSKLARIVDVYASRLQLQERLAQQVADAIQDRLKPEGVAVVLSAQHGCMTCRGARKPGAVMVTSVMLGRFREDPAARAEVLQLMQGG